MTGDFPLHSTFRIPAATDCSHCPIPRAMRPIERITHGLFRLLERLFPLIGRVLHFNQLETITDDVFKAVVSTVIIGNHKTKVRLSDR
ncbi:hypothetical protein [Paeniglutamicibacter terrestris]|uniref:Transposase DDE domain-containing protein n=1 Tax=Paeniglutamicibacter terrestris TaxID=2723403 RepID=A0ABX1G1M8_9MICC|nr:hypothetical protein [Paeniglutamicibacter terrestris]